MHRETPDLLHQQGNRDEGKQAHLPCPGAACHTPVPTQAMTQSSSTSVVSSATMCWHGHTCSHTCSHPMGPPAHLFSHQVCLISVIWWHRHTGLHALPQLRTAMCGGVGTLVHVLTVSAGPRGVCLPVTVSRTIMWRCRSTCSHACFKSQQQHLAVQMFALLMTQSLH